MGEVTASGGGESGVTVTYVKSKRVVYLTGWYDGFVGVWTGDAGEKGLPLAEFLDRLGITDADIRKARKEASDE